MDGKSISFQQLYERSGSASAPVLGDVRREDAFGADEAMIIGAVRRSPETMARWQCVLPKGRDVVVYCVHGDEVSHGVAGALQTAGTKAAYLEGGIADWRAHDLPTRRKRDASVDSIAPRTGHSNWTKTGAGAHTTALVAPDRLYVFSPVHGGVLHSKGLAK
jgi:rhodanese-related sulfurtransferase